MLSTARWETDDRIGLLYYSITDADGRRCQQIVLIESRSCTLPVMEGFKTEIEWRWRDQFSDEWGGPYETREEAVYAAGIFISDTRKDTP